MRTDFRFTVGRVLALIAAALLFGCAPANNNMANSSTNQALPNRMAAMLALGASTSGSSASSAGFSCPAAPNVNLKDNITTSGSFDYAGTEDFTVCRSSTTATQFKVTGSTQSQALCFYPMNESAAGQPQMAGQPQCWSVTGKPILLDFSQFATGQINYMVVVDVNYTDAMTACLSSTSPCPAHSEGFVQ